MKCWFQINKYLWNIYYVPVHILNTLEELVNKTQNPCSHQAYARGKSQMNKINEPYVVCNLEDDECNREKKCMKRERVELLMVGYCYYFKFQQGLIRTLYRQRFEAGKSCRFGGRNP